MKIAIIGFGVAGGATLGRIIDRDNQDSVDEILVFESRSHLAVGLPYQPDDEALIVNSYARDLSLNAEDPEDFIQWLAEHYPDIDAQDEFVPRQIYGQYIQSIYLPYLNDERVRIIHERVTTVKPQTQGKAQYQLQTDNGEVLVDAVFLCIGHPPYADYYDLRGSDGYIHTPYPVSSQLWNLAETDHVGIIGSSLTALDVVDYLLGQYDFEFPISFLIREEPFTTLKKGHYDGQVKYSLTDTWLDHELQKAGRLTLKAIIDRVQADLASEGVDLKALYERYPSGSLAEMKEQLVNQPKAMRYATAYANRLAWDWGRLLPLLSADDRQTFFERIVPVFDHFHGQMPATKIKKIFKWLEAGEVRFITGLEEIFPQTAGGFEMTNRSGTVYHQDILINATGFDMRLEDVEIQDPLIDQLYQDRVILPHPQGGILVSEQSGELLSARYGQLKHMYLASLWVNSTYFPLNNAQRIARLAQRHVDHFFASL